MSATARSTSSRSAKAESACPATSQAAPADEAKADQQECPVSHGEHSEEPKARITGKTRLGDPFRLTRFPLFSMRHATDRRIPGPVGLPVVGDLSAIRRDPYAYVQKAQQRYGDIAKVPMPGFDVVLLSHPELLGEVLDHSGNYAFLPWPEFITRITGEGLGFIDDPEKYRERRHMYTPLFGKRLLSSMADDFVDEMTNRLAAWEKFADTGEVVDLQQQFLRVLMAVFLRNMFSTSFSEEQVDAIGADLNTVLRAVASPVTGRPPNLKNAVISYQRSMRMLDDLMDARQKDSAEHADLLQLVMDADLPRSDARLDMWGFLIAGYDTVSSAMSWMFAYLPTNPEAQQKLYDEVDSLGGRPPVAEDINNLKWARQCFDEAQRLQGNPFLPRYSLKDNVIGGYRIPKGSMVGISFTNVHRDPRWWARPDVFDPHHHDKEQAAERPRLAFIPFSAGMRSCVGMAMAYQNAMLLTTLLLQRYRVHLQPGWSPRHEWIGTTVIKGGLPCTITRR